jgi:hypothetical protein
MTEQAALAAQPTTATILIVFLVPEAFSRLNPDRFNREVRPYQRLAFSI